jgi:two-component system sensor histidine kinase HydH
MREGRRWYVLAIFVSGVCITYLHYSTLETGHSLHDIYRQLYYIPLLIGALVFGLRGAAITYLFVCVLYIPYLAGTWTGALYFEAKRLIFLLFAGIVTFLAGFFIDRDMKRKADLGKERYLAGLGQVSTAIAHDLKNPLVTILGYARRIREGKGDAVQSAGIIMDSAEVMQNIVTDVLDFARPIRVEEKDEDAGSVIRRACDVCWEKAGERGVSLKCDIPETRLQIRLDPSRMQRALVNLITNAIDASESGGEVTILAARDGDRILITVTDGGAGMDRDTIENIFILFYTRKQSGTGLGMSIAKKVVEAHGGTIQVRSGLGQGTQVTIALPLKRKLS